MKKRAMVWVLLLLVGSFLFLGLSIYNKYRESIIEAGEVEREKSKTAIEELKTLQESNIERAAIAQKLADLGNLDRLSEVQKYEARKAINYLGTSYKKYGVAIDDVTGKLNNAEKAQVAMLEADKEKEINKIELTLKQLEVDKKAQEYIINTSISVILTRWRKML